MMKASFWASGRLLAGCLVLLMLLGVAGCSPSKSTVSGKVYFQKKPLHGGTVLFFSSEGNGSRSATIGEDGSYTIADMPAGKVKISVETDSAKKINRSSYARRPPKDTPAEADANPVYNKPAAATGSRYVKIPANYGDPEQSGLTFEVTGGNVTHDIELD